MQGVYLRMTAQVWRDLGSTGWGVFSRGVGGGVWGGEGGDGWKTCVHVATQMHTGVVMCCPLDSQLQRTTGCMHTYAWAWHGHAQHAHAIPCNSFLSPLVSHTANLGLVSSTGGLVQSLVQDLKPGERECEAARKAWSPWPC